VIQITLLICLRTGASVGMNELMPLSDAAISQMKGLLLQAVACWAANGFGSEMLCTRPVGHYRRLNRAVLIEFRWARNLPKPNSMVSTYRQAGTTGRAGRRH
jgi:hypothetical protein